MLKLISKATTRKGQATEVTKKVNGKNVTTMVDGDDTPITMNLNGETVDAVLLTFEAGSLVGGKWKGLLKPNRGTNSGLLGGDQEMLIAAGIAANNATSSPYLRHQQLFTAEQAEAYKEGGTYFNGKTIIERYSLTPWYKNQKAIEDTYLPGSLKAIDGLPQVYRGTAFKDEALKLETSNLAEFAEEQALLLQDEVLSDEMGSDIDELAPAAGNL